jgi:hypothetical protein
VLSVTGTGAGRAYFIDADLSTSRRRSGYFAPTRPRRGFFLRLLQGGTAARNLASVLPACWAILDHASRFMSTKARACTHKSGRSLLRPFMFQRGKKTMRRCGRGRPPTRWSQMRTPDQYRELAAECYRLAAEARTEKDCKILEEIARAWRELAEEVETKS